jgi:hypothetical protein
MAIVISGVNNNDKITASDGTIDLLSGVSYAGIITAPAFTTPGNITASGNLTAGHLNIGSGIQLGNAGVATATTFVGNLTGNVNATSNLLLQIGGSEKFRVGSSGQLGIGGANYGSSGQVLSSGGSGSAATWQTIDLSNLNANNLTSGTVPQARLPVTVATTSDLSTLENNVAVLGFKVATNGSLSRYSLVNQVIDEFNDATGIDASASSQYVLDSGYIFGGTSTTGNATGGIITTVSGYKYHAFYHTGGYNGNTSHNFVVPGTGTLEYLLVAGGGRGQSTHNGWNQAGNSGGGEGGDTVNNTSFSATAQTYTIVVGGGGEGWTSSASNNGQNSTGFGATANGGAGNSYNESGTGADGQQFTNFSQFGEQVSGGGYFGGDGGSGNNSNNVYQGGKGGGGKGGTGEGNAHSDSGVNGTGGGGGGASHTYAAGNGGHGIVLVRYQNNAFTSQTEGGDLTLQSVDTTAVDGAPTKADLIMLIENFAGTATLNTDIKGYISRDSGTTFTQGTLVDEGSYATSTKKIIAFHDLDIGTQPSGTSICYKITTHNQSASKKTRIHAVSYGWK